MDIRPWVRLSSFALGRDDKEEGETVSIKADYLGMPLSIDELDGEKLAIQALAAHDFHLQQCEACNLLRYPPTTGSMVHESQGQMGARRGQGSGAFLQRGTHAIQPAFKAITHI